jgi:hypothetical protein
MYGTVSRPGDLDECLVAAAAAYIHDTLLMLNPGWRRSWPFADSGTIHHLLVVDGYIHRQYLVVDEAVSCSN